MRGDQTGCRAPPIWDYPTPHYSDLRGVAPAAARTSESLKNGPWSKAGLPAENGRTAQMSSFGQFVGGKTRPKAPHSKHFPAVDKVYLGTALISQNRASEMDLAAPSAGA